MFKHLPLLIILLFGFQIPVGAQGDPSTKPIVVASKNFTESRLLAEMMAQLIEARTQIPVERRMGLGGTLVVFNALSGGEVDIYAEYTGTAWSVILKKEERAPDPLETYLTVKNEFEKRYEVTWLDPFGFNNGYAVAILNTTAERLNISRISDLEQHKGELKIGWSLEFLNRLDGWPGLRDHYNLGGTEVRGMEHGLAYEAIRSGQIDLIDAYTTDGKLLKFPLKILTDDKNFFPPYQCAPLIRMSTLELHPELKNLLEELAFKLPDQRMQKLNYEVEESGRPFADVARSFLIEERLLTEDAPKPVSEVLSGGTNWQFAVARIPVTIRLIGEHLFLTVIAVLLAILLAVPLGVFLTRHLRWQGIMLGSAGVIQTIPSLALLAFMIPIPGFGLSARSAIAALFLYALLPILRNTYTGINEVDADTIEAAEGMGLTGGQILRYIQLPLAMPTIMAGVRTATVISIGVATLAAFIGAGGLGEPIVTGMQLNEPRLILAGAIPAAVLALLADWLLGRLEKAMTPIQ